MVFDLGICYDFSCACLPGCLDGDCSDFGMVNTRKRFGSNHTSGNRSVQFRRYQGPCTRICRGVDNQGALFDVCSTFHLPEKDRMLCPCDILVHESFFSPAYLAPELVIPA